MAGGFGGGKNKPSDSGKAEENKQPSEDTNDIENEITQSGTNAFEGSGAVTVTDLMMILFGSFYVTR